MKALEKFRCQAPPCKRYKQAALNDQSVYVREKCTSLIDLCCSWSHVNKSCYHTLSKQEVNVLMTNRRILKIQSQKS